MVVFRFVIMSSLPRFWVPWTQKLRFLVANSELSKVPSFKPEVGQNMDSYVPPAERGVRVRD